jgi:hypothetical protein
MAHQVYVLIRATLKALQDFADEIDFDLKLDSNELKRVLEAGDPEAKIKPIKINDSPEFCSFTPYEHMYGRYEKSLNQNVYFKAEDGTPFSRITRVKLVYYLLQSRVSMGGLNFNLSRMVKKKWLLAVFPMHDQEKKKRLFESWLPWGVLPWNQPLDDIKDCKLLCYLFS